MKDKYINIILVEIVNYNFGDCVIADCTEYLIKKALPEKEKGMYRIQRYNLFSEDYEMLDYADMIVFAGGGLIKYRFEKLYNYICKILGFAILHKIPVYFNSVGVEDYDREDENCAMLQAMLIHADGAGVLAGITVRDDLDTLKHKYLPNGRCLMKAVCDPAVYAATVYDIKKYEGSDTIGIGISRAELFADYGHPEIDKAYQIKMWTGLTKELEQRGYQWQFFVNGAKDDWLFAREMLTILGHEEEADKYLMGRPADGKALVETIAEYKGIIAGRMHANIIAYSLGIPSIGLVWNQKLSYWGEKIGYPERFLDCTQLNAITMADSLERALKKGVRQKGYFFRHGVYKYLKKFVTEHSSLPLTARTADYDWRDHMAATALGGYIFRYNDMNSPFTIRRCIMNGFQYLETDVRFTPEGNLVCINGWNPKSYNKMGIDPEKYGLSGMPYKEFMKSRLYYDNFTVIDFPVLAKILEQYKGVRLIIDLGRPNRKDSTGYIKAFTKLFQSEKHLYDSCIFRLQTRYDVENFRKQNDKLKLMYFYPGMEALADKNETLNDMIDFVKGQNIEWVSISKENALAPALKDMKAAGLKLCVFSYQTVGEIKQMANMGVDLIATHYLSPNMLNELNVLPEN